MKNELKHNQIKELININLKVVDSKEKIVPININDKHFLNKEIKNKYKINKFKSSSNKTTYKSK